MKAYISVIFGDRTPPPRHLHKALTPLITTITPEEFATYALRSVIPFFNFNNLFKYRSVLPTVDRSLKRNPEVVINEVSVLLANLPFDLSSFVKASPSLRYIYLSVDHHVA